MGTRRLGLAMVAVALWGVGCKSSSGGDGTIGAAGGEVSALGVRVIVPRDALEAATKIEVKPASGDPSGAVGGTVSLEPDGTQFAVPVTIEFAWDPATLLDPAHPETLQLATVAGGGWQPLDGNEVDLVKRVVRAKTTHFSHFGLVQRCTGDSRCLDCDSVKGCCYPICDPPGLPLMCSGQGACGYPCHCEGIPRDMSAPPDLSVPYDLSAPPDDMAARLDDLAPPPVDMTCVPNVGPGCCWPTCNKGETLVCLGANICGYPCSCQPTD